MALASRAGLTSLDHVKHLQQMSETHDQKSNMATHVADLRKHLLGIHLFSISDHRLPLWRISWYPLFLGPRSLEVRRHSACWVPVAPSPDGRRDNLHVVPCWMTLEYAIYLTCYLASQTCKHMGLNPKIAFQLVSSAQILGFNHKKK